MGFMDFRMFEKQARNATGINIISFAIPDTTVDKKTKISACIVYYVIHAFTFIKQHESDDIKHGMGYISTQD